MVAYLLSLRPSSRVQVEAPVQRPFQREGMGDAETGRGRWLCGPGEAECR